ncbi:ribosome silencing factor [Candidatus Aerophobetes bacterium]|nr:ribosome silencing factor [Candidatus Aerophobetes bacterium]
MAPKRLALEIAKIAEEKKAQQVVLMDLSGLSVVCDYFLICSGESSVHMRAIAKDLEEKLSKKGITLLNSGGYFDKRWILLDFGNVVVHIFSPETREYYQLERLWADAKRKDISDFSRTKDKINI